METRTTAPTPQAAVVKPSRRTIAELRQSAGRDRIRRWLWVPDLILAPLVFCSAVILRVIRQVSIAHVPFSQRILDWVGIFPVKRHFYESFIDVAAFEETFDRPRELPGIDLNLDEQLELLNSFRWTQELLDIPLTGTDPLQYRYANTTFAPPDSEYLYQLIRAIKPRRIVEIGSGMSTLMAQLALRKNQEEDTSYRCRHICIEPYCAPWLEQTGVEVLRKRIEQVDPGLIESLQANDLLFIDSTHMIRAQGDVVVEYLNLLPRVQSGVYVHVHDIFTPWDYPKQCVVDLRLQWNEQYLLEAFLTLNREFRIVGALHYLQRQHTERLRAKCPNMDETCTALSFYIVRN